MEALFINLIALKWRWNHLLLVICLLTVNSCKESDTADTDTEAQTERIVSLHGSLTELLYELGYGDELVGVDVTSTYPTEAAALPKLGHVSQLNTEAILQLRPSIVFVAAKDAAQNTLSQLTGAGVKVVSVELVPKLDNALSATQFLQKHLAVSDKKITELSERIKKEQQQLALTLAQTSARPKVLFVYARGTGSLMVAGKETDAARMIELAGGQNAITSFDNFEALSPEALLAAAPEVILMFTSGLASLDGVAGLSQVPGISQTPAFKNEHIVAMDGHYLLGFGPRAAQAANDLATRLQTFVIQ